MFIVGTGVAWLRGRGGISGAPVRQGHGGRSCCAGPGDDDGQMVEGKLPLSRNGDAESGGHADCRAMAAEAPAAMAMADSVEVAETIPQAAEDFLPPFDEVRASVAAQERIIVRHGENGGSGGQRAGGGGPDWRTGGWLGRLDGFQRPQRSALGERVGAGAGAGTGRGGKANSRPGHPGWMRSRPPARTVTDEYVDTSSRLRSLRATEESLLNLLGQATKVEDALDVQRELADLQSEIESWKGASSSCSRPPPFR